AARRGLLLRSGDALLALADAEEAVLDKTGTLTGGEPVVVRADDDVLRLAAGPERYSRHPIARAIAAAATALRVPPPAGVAGDERYSRHPIARAIVAEAIAREIPLPVGVEVEEQPGRGIRGRVDGRRLRLGAAGAGEVLLSDEEGPIGTLRFADTLREDAAR